MNLQVDGSVLGAGDGHFANSALIIKTSCTEIWVGRGLSLVAGLGAESAGPARWGWAGETPPRGPTPVWQP